MAPSMWQILIVLLIVLLVFGTKKLRNMGGDIGGAIKNFKSSMRDGEAETKDTGESLTASDAAKREAAAKREDSNV